MNIFMKIFKPANDLREKIENSMSDALEKMQDCEKLDVIEAKLFKAGIKAGVAYFAKGSSPLTDEQYEKIAETMVQGMNKLNPVIVKQLRK